MITVIAGGLACVPSAALAQDAPAETAKAVADEHELFHKYVASTLGLEGAVHAAMTSAWAQVQHSPPEWGSGADGYAKRLASDYASSAIGDTTKYGVARLLHHDPSFTPCQCTGSGRRLRYALLAPFTARTPDGRRVVSPAFFAGAVAGRVVPAATWYPARHGAMSGLEQSVSSLAAKMVIDVWKEFRPPPKPGQDGAVEKLLIE
jgi:hypothetical protein